MTCYIVVQMNYGELYNVLAVFTSYPAAEKFRDTRKVSEGRLYIYEAPLMEVPPTK